MSFLWLPVCPDMSTNSESCIVFLHHVLRGQSENCLFFLGRLHQRFIGSCSTAGIGARKMTWIWVLRFPWRLRRLWWRKTCGICQKFKLAWRRTNCKADVDFRKMVNRREQIHVTQGGWHFAAAIVCRIISHVIVWVSIEHNLLGQSTPPFLELCDCCYCRGVVRIVTSRISFHVDGGYYIKFTSGCTPWIQLKSDMSNCEWSHLIWGSSFW